MYLSNQTKIQVKVNNKLVFRNEVNCMQHESCYYPLHINIPTTWTILIYLMQQTKTSGVEQLARISRSRYPQAHMMKRLKYVYIQIFWIYEQLIR